MTLFGILNIVAGLIQGATPIVVALALLYFFWGLASYILKSGDDEGQKKARNTMIWGILALFIMVSVWGIINVIRDTLLLDNSNIQVPGIGVQPARPNQ